MPRPYSRCFACGSRPLLPFYEQRDAPAATALLTSRAEALRFPRCSIRLAFCPRCGFIQDVIPDTAQESMPIPYRDSSEHSHFARTLAERYGLEDKAVTNLGAGEDPFAAALAGERAGHIEHVGLEHSAWSFSTPDFVTCLQGLDQVRETSAFMAALRRHLGTNHGPVVVFETADTRRSLSDLAFWDMRGGRRSYFTIGSLARLFRRHEFDLFDLRRSCDSGSIVIDAVASGGITEATWPEEDDLEEVRLLVGYFRDNHASRMVQWNQTLKAAISPVLWGAGPAEVAFLSNMDAAARVPFAVDPDRDRIGRYIPVAGTEVLPPGALREARPDVIITLSRRHEADAQECLALFGLTAEVLTP